MNLLEMPELPNKILTPSMEEVEVFNTQSKFSVEDNAIRLKNIHVTFCSGREYIPILKGINWSIPKGIVQFLMGPSGSGKTTLLSVIAGLLTPTSGQICLLNQDITRMKPKERAQFRLTNIGFIFQEFNLFATLTASENVEVALNLKGIDGKAVKQQASELLEQVGLSAQQHQHPDNLSGGQKQRVAIARALAADPSLIMADEPTAALDAENGRSVAELLSRLAKERGSTILIVTHDPRILDLADRIAQLDDGWLHSDSTLKMNAMNPTGGYQQ